MEAALIERGMTVAYGSIVTVHGEVLHNESHHHLLGQRDLLLADVGAETAGRLGRRRHPHLAGLGPLLGHPAGPLRGGAGRAARHHRRGAPGRPLPRPAPAGRAAPWPRGWSALGILRGDPDELVADGVVYLLFPHGIGHLLGLDVHDMEDLGDRAGYLPGRSRAPEFGIRYLRLDRDLAPGMAVTIEPGIYITPRPGFAGWIRSPRSP